MKNTKEINKARAVIYCRVSTKEQVDEGNSLYTQERICREYAAEIKYNVDRVFIEQGESAKTQHRTELQKMFQYCSMKKNGIGAVIVYRLDRISRNMDDYSQIRLLLKRYGVEIKSKSENFEDTPAGRFMENMMANIAEFDNNVRAERCTNGMKEAVREGRYVWLAPIGYDNIRIGNKTNIAPNKDASLVKKIFVEIAASSSPLEEIRKSIIHQGLQTRNKKPLSKAQFYRLIRNELYTGRICKFGDEFVGSFEAIVSEPLFEKVQRILRSRGGKRESYKLFNSDFPLRRFVKNLEGDSLTGAWSRGRYRKYPYYRFPSNSKSYGKVKFENKFKELLDAMKIDRIFYKQIVSSLRKHFNFAIAQNKKTAINLKAEIEECKTERLHLFAQHRKQLIDDSLLKEELLRIQNKIDSLGRKLDSIPDFQENFNELLNLSGDYLKQPSTVWEKASIQKRIALQRFNFPEGITFDGKKFRTTVIPNIYKANLFFSNKLSHLVDHPKLKLNHQRLSISTQKASVLPPKMDWQAITNDITELAQIMKEDPETPP